MNQDQKIVQSYTDHTLRKMALFFKTYRPTYQDVEWAKARKAAVEAEIARRAKEEQEGTL